MADTYFIIGTNIEGFISYVNKAWEDLFKEFTFWPNALTLDADLALSIFNKIIEKYRITLNEGEILHRLKIMMKHLTKEENTQNYSHLISKIGEADFMSLLEASDFPDKVLIIKFYQEALKNCKNFNAFKEKIKQAKKDQCNSINSEFMQLLTQYFKSKFVLILDPQVSPNRLTHQITLHTPPGLLNKMMGLQNIKGPGLAFIHALEDWEECYKAGQNLLLENPTSVTNGLLQLQSISSYNLFSIYYLKNILKKSKHSIAFQQENLRIKLTALRISINTSQKRIAEELKYKQQINPITLKVVTGIEAFLDLGDSVRRKKKANKIYKKLIHDKISYDQAILELRQLEERQHGGWLVAKFLEFKEYMKLILASLTHNKITN